MILVVLPDGDLFTFTRIEPVGVCAQIIPVRSQSLEALLFVWRRYCYSVRCHVEVSFRSKWSYYQVQLLKKVYFLVAPSKRSDLSGHYGVCMYVGMDVRQFLVRQLSNRKINHILTHTKEFFLTADLAWPKLTPPPPPGQNWTKSATYLLISTIS